MRWLLLIPLFLFFILPPQIALSGFNSTLQVSTQNNFSQTPAADGLVPTSQNESGESEEESESSRLSIDDDDKLPHSPTWTISSITPIYIISHSGTEQDGICRRLFKPPKA